MATKITAIITVLLFFFASGHASASFKLPDDVASIFLPTEKPDSFAETKYASKERESGSEIEKESRLPVKEIKAEAEMKAETVPLTVISFRPIKRRFPQLPLLHSMHKCRRRVQRGQIKPWWKSRLDGRRFPYGKDMISANKAKRGGLRFDLASGAGEGIRTVPPRWSRFHERGKRFPFLHDLYAKKINRKPHRNHVSVDKEHGLHHHPRHHDHNRNRDLDLDHSRAEGEEYKIVEREMERDNRYEQNHKHQGGFMSKIWKLLDGF